MEQEKSRITGKSKGNNKGTYIYKFYGEKKPLYLKTDVSGVEPMYCKEEKVWTAQ